MSEIPDPAATATIETLFPTRIYRAELNHLDELRQEIIACCLSAAEDDEAGIAWSEEHGYPGYTSYASLDDLPWRFPPFAELKDHLDAHAAHFARELCWELGDRELVLDAFWINLLEPGGFHSGHLHPNSVISGTFYVEIPDGASALKFEDPRLARMMGAPPKLDDAPRDQMPFITMRPSPCTLMMWESWLRHEVVLNRAETERISVSFNYAWR